MEIHISTYHLNNLFIIENKMPKKKCNNERRSIITEYTYKEHRNN